MSSATQANRLMALTVESLPDDALLVVALDGQESVSSLFSFRLKCVSEVPKQIKLQKILERGATIRIKLFDGSERFIHGLISRCSCDGKEVGDDKRFTHYTIEVVPWLWLLKRTTDCRIFQDKTTPDIIQKIFQDLGFSDFKLSLKGQFEARDYCVQYRESDFNFVSRLMEEEGIFYYFEHAQGKHTLVLSNALDMCQKNPQQSSARYEPEKGMGEWEDTITSWSERRTLRSGKVAARDHHFEMPNKPLDAKTPSVIKVGSNDKFELYDYPGLHATRFNKPGERMGKVEPLGDHYAKLRMEEEEGRHEVAKAKSFCRAFFTGSKFKFDAPSDLTSGEFVLTSIKHKCRSEANFVSGDNPVEEYSNSFTCIPATAHFRPRRVTTKPVVHGAQTAEVVGPEGEEIYPDKFSRVKVQFHWDREGKKNADSSCWVRVGTPWAGKQWGMIHIPRIGQEVIVDFLEGDPDQPIIVGSVYNADQMPPYDLPANATQSGIKTRSSKGGSPDNFNELRFEDKKGSEQLFIHAEKNQDIEVENDETHWVGHDRTKTIDNDETTHVKHDRTETVDNNETITIGANRTETVGKNESITIGANRTEMVGINETVTIGVLRTHTIGAADILTIGAAQQISIGAAQGVTIGGPQTTSVGGSQSLTVGQSQSESIGKNRAISVEKDDALKVGKKLMVEAGEEIMIKTGDASIYMKKDGTIKISGKNITINASGEISAKASKNVTIKGQKILQN